MEILAYLALFIIMAYAGYGARAMEDDYSIPKFSAIVFLLMLWPLVVLVLGIGS